MGKTFLEKILRSTEVGKVYLLLRPKKGIEPKNRMLTIFEDPVSLKLL
jgi:fatty acyl-CoA reductase